MRTYDDRRPFVEAVLVRGVQEASRVLRVVYTTMPGIRKIEGSICESRL